MNDGPQFEPALVHRYNDALVIEKYVLPNGLVVLYVRDHQAPIFSFQTWFRVGSRHEHSGKTGLAHLFEHLMFKETSNTPEGEFDRILEGYGARVNAGTWLDWTYYYEDVPAAHFDEVVALEADRMQNVVLDTDQLEAEREVVINERRERVDNDPIGKLSEVLWDTAFDVHPYGHPTIGWMSDIEGLSVDDCLGFYRTYYSPNNAVICVVGDVEPNRLLGAIDKHYGHMESQTIPAPDRVTEPRQEAPRRAERSLALSAQRLLIGYRAPGINEESHPALEVLNEILAEGDSCRLQRALVTDGELAAGFGAFVPPFRDPGLYEISVDMRPEHAAEEAEEVVLAEIAHFIEKGVRDLELRKAKSRLETDFYRGLQTAQQKAQGLGFWEVVGGDFRRLFTIGERYRAVSADQVVEIAREVLRPENRTVVVGRPL